MTAIQKIAAKIFNKNSSKFATVSKEAPIIETKLIKIVDDLENLKTGNEAIEYIINACENGELEKVAGNFFEKDNYFIKNLFKREGLLYGNNLERLDSFNLGILPKHIKTIVKGGDAFVIGKYNCAKDTKIVPYFKMFREIPKEQKIAAFDDIKALAKKGYTSPDIIKYPNTWKVSTADKKILLSPSISIRPVEKGENKAILEEVRQLIFH